MSIVGNVSTGGITSISESALSSSTSSAVPPRIICWLMLLLYGVKSGQHAELLSTKIFGKFSFYDDYQVGTHRHHQQQHDHCNHKQRHRSCQKHHHSHDQDDDDYDDVEDHPFILYILTNRRTDRQTSGGGDGGIVVKFSLNNVTGAADVAASDAKAKRVGGT
ncbi:hypothetical protein FF38_07574 [Lucilia cuprina]|uniref:Uncharacterized protein n=1 Tax=Lucilia cuprina TaxID=7375 RepID=A0A0L0BZG5_LUCCU|nr:hypothetical protein FF38_07574 [Lucilia cuprina]